MRKQWVAQVSKKTSNNDTLVSWVLAPGREYPFFVLNYSTVQRSMNKQTHITIAIAIAVPLLTMGAGCVAQSMSSQTDADMNSSSSHLSTSTRVHKDDALAVSADIEPGREWEDSDSGTSTIPTGNYTAALALYEKGKTRFQFDTCLDNPGAMHLKPGTKFMIDNHDTVHHMMGVGTKTYDLSARNFAIITIQKTGSFNITCDGVGDAHVEINN